VLGYSTRPLNRHGFIHNLHSSLSCCAGSPLRYPRATSQFKDTSGQLNLSTSIKLLFQPRDLIRSVGGLLQDQADIKLAGNKGRRFSREGGLLNRMFGASPTPGKDHEHAIVPPSPTEPISSPGLTPRTPSMDASHTDSSASGEKRNNSTSTAPGRKSSEDAGSGADKKRRSSGVAKASALFATAKNSLHLSHVSHASNSTPPQTPMQKLSKTDPALGVPQGSLNNSAGESRPGPRSTFRVGVTEDKNKKCRRTMEDTHAYLYNFLSTPAPLINTETSSSASNEDSTLKGSSTTSTTAISGNDADSVHTIASRVVETDNGYFAIFDGHAGTFAADWCGKKLHVLLEDIIRKNPNSAIPELLDQAFTSADQQLEKLPLKNSGCTAICAVLRWEDRIPNPQSATGSTAMAPIAAAVAKAHESSGNGTIPENAASLVPSVQEAMAAPTTASAMPKLQASASRQRVLYTANVGDARIVLCRNGKALRLSYDHKGSDENEGRRITNAGGLILNNRVNGVLAVTRALGDTYMKDLVTGHPYTTETVIQPDIDEFLILACDGVSPLPYELDLYQLTNILALGCLYRSRSRRLNTPYCRPSSCFETIGGPRLTALLHRQSILHGCKVR
jgi:protein phosphatase PTC1